MKTIQRIAGARGFIIKARRLQEVPLTQPSPRRGEG
jgi:hypothetical protein